MRDFVFKLAWHENKVAAYDMLDGISRLWKENDDGSLTGTTTWEEWHNLGENLCPNHFKYKEGSGYVEPSQRP